MATVVSNLSMTVYLPGHEKFTDLWGSDYFIPRPLVYTLTYDDNDSKSLPSISLAASKKRLSVLCPAHG